MSALREKGGDGGDRNGGHHHVRRAGTRPIDRSHSNTGRRAGSIKDLPIGQVLRLRESRRYIRIPAAP